MSPGPEAELVAWFRTRLPKGWFDGAPQLRVDREEILLVGHLPGVDDEGDEALVRFREETREQRMAIAEEAEASFGRKVSWAVSCGGTECRFTTASVPVMTRLRMDERAVLDTLIDAGVARSRSEALAWCVRLVGRHEHDWLVELRDAVEHVRRARDEGPVVD